MFLVVILMATRNIGGQMVIQQGKEIDEITSQLGLSQLINEPTNFEPKKNPTCIDLIFTDEPNFVLESGITPSLNHVLPNELSDTSPPPFDRKIWNYEKAIVTLIRRCIFNFPWQQHCSFIEIFLNIICNFIPNNMVRIAPSDPPWITKPIKAMPCKQNRQYTNYKRHGCR